MEIQHVSRDPAEQDKAKRANDILADRDLALSVQVLQEFYVQATRASRPDAIGHSQAVRLIESFRRFPVQDLTSVIMMAALDTRQRFQLSYWDAAIIEASRAMGVPGNPVRRPQRRPGLRRCPGHQPVPLSRWPSGVMAVVSSSMLAWWVIVFLRQGGHVAGLRRGSWLRFSRGRIAGVGAAVMIVSGAGVALTPAASASTGPVEFSPNGAGYQVSGRWFRYVQTVVQLPSSSVCAQLYQAIGGPAPRTFGASVGATWPGHTGISVSIVTTPNNGGCGGYQAAFEDGPVSGPQMLPGDLVKLSFYYDQAAGSVSLNVRDLTRATGQGDVVVIGTNAIFSSAGADDDYVSLAAPPTSQFQAFEFTQSAATTYTGTRGALTGPWMTRQVVMTRASTTSPILASNPVLWDGGANFGTWIRAS